MPRMSGSEIAEVLLMDHPDMQVLFATGYAEKGIVDEGVLKPGIELLRKPYDHAQLQARIRNLMDRRSPQRS